MSPRLSSIPPHVKGTALARPVSRPLTSHRVRVCRKADAPQDARDTQGIPMVIRDREESWPTAGQREGDALLRGARARIRDRGAETRSWTEQIVPRVFSQHLRRYLTAEERFAQPLDRGGRAAIVVPQIGEDVFRRQTLRDSHAHERDRMWIRSGLNALSAPGDECDARAAREERDIR